MIKRTKLAETPHGAAWFHDYWGSYGYADTAFTGDYPTHSPVLGPNGQPLAYEPRQTFGFDLTGRSPKPLSGVTTPPPPKK